MTERILTVPADSIEGAIGEITSRFLAAREAEGVPDLIVEAGDLVRVVGPPGTETQVYRVVAVSPDLQRWTCEPA